MKASKKLIGASVALVAALAVSVGSTYAWFTTNNTATVDGISGTVTTNNASLEVKVVNKDGAEDTLYTAKNGSAATWGYNISFPTGYFNYANDLDALTYDKDNGKFTAKAPDGSSTSYNVGGTTPGASTGATADAYTGGKFVEFYLALRSTQQLNVYLGENSSLESTAPTTGAGSVDMVYAWDDSITEATYGTAVSEGAAIAAAAQNAARVGFDTNTTASTTVTTGYTSSNKVWAPHEEYAGGNPSTAIEDEAEAQDPQGYYKGNLAKAYETYLGNQNLDAKYTNPAYTGVTSAGIEGEDESLVVTLSEGTVAIDGIQYHVAYIRVLMWIEGTDGDCFNNIFGDTITLSLSFVAAEVED